METQKGLLEQIARLRLELASEAEAHGKTRAHLNAAEAELRSLRSLYARSRAYLLRFERQLSVARQASSVIKQD